MFHLFINLSIVYLFHVLVISIFILVCVRLLCIERCACVHVCVCMSVDHIADRFQHLCYILIHIVYLLPVGPSDSSDPSSLVETEAALFCSSS